MSVSSDLWHVCQYWACWKNIYLKISHRNIKPVIENRTLLQCRFSSNNSASVTVYSWFISSELIDSLMKVLSSNKPQSLKLIGTYHGCWKLLRNSLESISEVDMTKLKSYGYVNKWSLLYAPYSGIKLSTTWTCGLGWGWYEATFFFDEIINLIFICQQIGLFHLLQVLFVFVNNMYEWPVVLTSEASFLVNEASKHTAGARIS